MPLSFLQTPKPYLWEELNKAAYYCDSDRFMALFAKLRPETRKQILTLPSKSGWTILANAARYLDSPTFIALLEKLESEDLNQMLETGNPKFIIDTPKGRTVLHIAARYQDCRGFQALLAKLSSETVDQEIIRQDNEGYTLVHLVVAYQQLTSLEALVRKASARAWDQTINLQNKDGETAIHFALGYDRLATFELLKTKISAATLSKALRIPNQANFTALGAIVKDYPSQLRLVIEKAPLALLGFNLNTVVCPQMQAWWCFINRPGQSVWNNTEEFINFLKMKLAPPPNTIYSHAVWLGILAEALNANPTEPIKNQLHYLSAFLETQVQHQEAAKQHCLALSSPENLDDATNLFIADLLSLDSSLSVLEKKQYKIKRLQHLYAARNNNDNTQSLLRSLLNKKPQISEELWSQADDEIYQQALEQLISFWKVKKHVQKKKVVFSSFFRNHLKTKAHHPSLLLEDFQFNEESKCVRNQKISKAI